MKKYAKAMQKICSKLNDGHTFIGINNYTIPEYYIRPLPILTKKVDNRVFINNAFSSQLSERGLKKALRY